MGVLGAALLLQPQLTRWKSREIKCNSLVCRPPPAVITNVSFCYQSLFSLEAISPEYFTDSDWLNQLPKRLYNSGSQAPEWLQVIQHKAHHLLEQLPSKRCNVYRYKVWFWAKIYNHYILHKGNDKFQAPQN